MTTRALFSTVAEAAEHLNSIIEYSFDGIFITDKDCNVLRINHSYEEITGLKKEEVLGRNMADLVQDKLISQSGSLIVANTKRPVTLQQQFKSGKEALVTSSPIFDKNGDFRAEYSHKSAYIARCIGRQIKDKICPRIALSHLIPRR